MESNTIRAWPYYLILRMQISNIFLLALIKPIMENFKMNKKKPMILYMTNAIFIQYILLKANK